MFNIKQYIKQVLSNDEILNLTSDKKVHFLHALDPIPPYVEYEIFDEDGAAWSEGKEVATNYYVQIDIFSKEDYTELENKIKEKMINAGFERTGGADLYEEDTQLYHKPMRFIYTTKIEGGI
ncbi:hypothetical protein [Clostridium tunisiense]|uniref:hypothetical protein n=1 Tax=Clostridium tunisiense TaxID=219748 RepID=UPI0003153DEC|nr:hypothetical protein [Clostridium tunisiense]